MPMKAKNKGKVHPHRIKSAYTTRFGRMYCGQAEEALDTWPISHYEGRVQMVFTSPPFPLKTKKKYGNLQGEGYFRWNLRPKIG
jgi:site-specific DNA-methyltransferase (cytosine-N4-specific)